MTIVERYGDVESARFRSSSRWWALGIAALIALLLLLIAASAFFIVRPEHRMLPTPKGLVLRLHAREVTDPLDVIRVRAADIGSPSIEVIVPNIEDNLSTKSVYDYPSGALRMTSGTKEFLDAPPADPWFDFDGDGTADTIQLGPGINNGLVQVISGASGAVLFVHLDPLEYETSERAFALGDLDGDGFGELALVHPRMDRSKYDLELWDRVFGAHSWITVVSGSRIEWP